jgi:uracil phosphoribosyltransferase
MDPYVFNHPLIDDKLAGLRDRRTGMAEFRRLVEQVTVLMLYEVSRDLPRKTRLVETPLAAAPCPVLAGDPPVLVPILRAGLAMVEPLLAVLPDCPVGHVGLARDHETLEPSVYLVKLPPLAPGRPVWVLDPMLATGGSVSAALAALKRHGAGRLSLLSVIAAPEGVERVRLEHPDVRMFLGALDEKLNQRGYILPGLGDAGDRLYGTE